MAKLFFLISGEHQTLPVSEVQAILKAEGIDYQIVEKLSQVLRIEADAYCVEPIRLRSALTRVCCQEIFNCEASLPDILGNIRSDVLDEFICDESFEVRVRRVECVTPELIRVDLERKLGEQILKTVKTSRVNLSNPKKTFFGVLTDNRFIFGLKTTEIIPKPFLERGPRRRPFFHPTAMPAKLARLMVNLAQPKMGDLMLDPFCGTGGMLVEAGLIGCRVVGFDAKPHMLRGGLKNLKHYEIKLEGVAIADARYPPVTGVDCIATDPPYGRSASTLGTNTRRIVEDFLSAAADMLPRGAKICMASPETIQIGETAEEAGFKHLESHFVYVHRSLTREIVVFEKT
ncbi:THUMP domain-containing protein [Candidatus Bathyarchaeota archaeon]|nr:THUMP domain-containing protein [Candidatus Bathyarchaeota archaeon]